MNLTNVHYDVRYNSGVVLLWFVKLTNASHCRSGTWLTVIQANIHNISNMALQVENVIHQCIDIRRQWPNNHEGQTINITAKIRQG